MARGEMETDYYRGENSVGVQRNSFSVRYFRICQENCKEECALNVNDFINRDMCFDKVKFRRSVMVFDQFICEK